MFLSVSDLMSIVYLLFIFVCLYNVLTFQSTIFHHVGTKPPLCSGANVSCLKTQHGAITGDRTQDLYIRSLMLYHYATTLHSLINNAISVYNMWLLCHAYLKVWLFPIWQIFGCDLVISCTMPIMGCLKKR